MKRNMSIHPWDLWVKNAGFPRVGVTFGSLVFIKKKTLFEAFWTGNFPDIWEFKGTPQEIRPYSKLIHHYDFVENPLRPADHQGKKSYTPKAKWEFVLLFRQSTRKVYQSVTWFGPFREFRENLGLGSCFFWSFSGQNFPKHTSQASVSKNFRFGVAKKYKTSRHLENLVHFSDSTEKNLLEVEIDQSSWGYIERWWFGSTTPLIRWVFYLKLLVPSKVHGILQLPWPNWWLHFTLSFQPRIASTDLAWPARHRWRWNVCVPTPTPRSWEFKSIGSHWKSSLGGSNDVETVMVEMFGDVVVGWFVKLPEVQQNMIFFW